MLVIREGLSLYKESFFHTAGPRGGSCLGFEIVVAV